MLLNADAVDLQTNTFNKGNLTLNSLQKFEDRTSTPWYRKCLLLKRVDTLTNVG